jgi:hypothetical protein
MPTDPHYPSRHSFHPPNFRGAIAALVQCIYTVSGVGTTSFTIDPSGYASNFEGLVQCIEDLNFTLSGVSAGGGVSSIQAGSGIYLTSSGTSTVINATVTSASGVTYTAGSGLFLVGSEFNINYSNVFQGSVSGRLFGAGDNTVSYSGNTVTISGSGTTGGGGGGLSVVVSGSPGVGYSNGSLWFDTNQGRMFVYASGNGVTAFPDWYQTNAEALAYKSEQPPSGTGSNAPARDGSLWFNTLLGSLFVYDATTSGWYETGPSRGISYSAAAPAPSTEGAVWVDSDSVLLSVWNGSAWVPASGL